MTSAPKARSSKEAQSSRRASTDIGGSASASASAGGGGIRQALGYSIEWGAFALTASSSLAAWIEYALLRRWLSRRIGGVPTPKGLLFGAAAAAIAAGAGGYGAAWLALGAGARAWQAALVAIPVFGAIYLGTMGRRQGPRGLRVGSSAPPPPFVAQTSVGTMHALVFDELAGACGEAAPTGEHLVLLLSDPPEEKNYRAVPEQSFHCPGNEVLAIVESDGGTDLAKSITGTLRIESVTGCVRGSYSITLSTLQDIEASFDAVVCAGITALAERAMSFIPPKVAQP